MYNYTIRVDLPKWIDFFDIEAEDEATANKIALEQLREYVESYVIDTYALDSMDIEDEGVL